ncbi:MAG: cation-translocating P-type ATPase [candidate division KSB1 bacterium]|nr:cation-translocating P-type ATPase [candidate division KSB1 bacterium]
MDQPLWHTLSGEEVLARLGSGPNGLSSAEAARRLAQYGPNELQEAEQISRWKILLSQFKNVLVIILLVATAISAALGHQVEALAISAIVLFSVFMGYLQEYRAERALEALRRMAALRATVIRDGSEQEVPAREIVPGDVLLLSVGDKVPADGRLLEVVNLQVDEAALTGESTPVEKALPALQNGSVPLGERANMVYSGTVVTYGRGRAVVVETGTHTEFGRVAELLKTVESGKTPLQENLARVGSMLARAALVLVALIGLLGVARGKPPLEMFLFAIAMAVAVVPEALPAVVTIALALGVQRMAKRNALVRRLPAVETLGCASVICTDKTGTLTKDEMTVRRLYVGGELIEVTGVGYEPVGEFRRGGEPLTIEGTDGPLLTLLRAAVLSSDAHLVRREEDGRWAIKGDPTEGALITVAAKAGLRKVELEEAWPRVHEIAFTSERKRMTTVHRGPSGLVAYAKGAPEVILASCAFAATNEGTVPLTGAARRRILATASSMARDAMRVLAVAWKPKTTAEDAEEKMTFLGLVGMVDPPRPEAKAALQKCRDAGIKVVMITGDHPETAQAIARELGLTQGGMAVTGREVDAMTDEELEEKVDRIDVYSRVSPSHKLRVVTALQKRGHVVAMTGDGVNDAPALKKADIGVAMGITGTDVSKEAAAMTLTDDNFASIVAAVEEGRGIFDNIKKFLMYLLSSNVGEIGLMAGALLAGLPLPLSAVQILYVNLATDGLPALALSVDPPAPDLMRRRPRRPRAGLFTRPVLALMAVAGIWSMLINLGLFSCALRSGRPQQEAMTMAFVSLIGIQFFKAYNFRSDRHSVLSRPLANKWLNLAIGWELALLCLIVYAHPLQRIFGTYALPLRDWLIVGVATCTVSIILEAAKALIRRGVTGPLE